MWQSLTKAFQRHFRTQSARPRRVRPGIEALEDRQVPALIVPALNSQLGARASLYLDFDGHVERNFQGRTEAATPAFDLDGNPASFNAQELAYMGEVWERVAEDFAPFNINVTTVRPASLAPGVPEAQANRLALRVAIGGSSKDWYGTDANGVAFGNSFTDGNPNLVHVFARHLGSANDVADTVSHEAGHAFGLAHQGTYDTAGRLVREYSFGTPDKAPLMGHSHHASRSTWHNGPTTSATTTQDGMAALAGAPNGLGYRADDHGNDFRSATPLNQLDNQFQVRGIIATTGLETGARADSDWFSFATTGGPVSLRVDVAARGANLNAKLELWRDVSGGNPVLVDSADPTTDLGASLNKNLAAGKYYVVVKSHGEYGDVGQYTLTGSAIHAPWITQATVIGDAIRPGQLPVGGALYAASSAYVTFNRPIAAASFDASDILFTGPDGRRIPILGVRLIDPQSPYSFEITFATQSRPGSYTMTIGPRITSRTGDFLMDQDRDGMPGETVNDQDAFRFSFSIRDSFFDYLDYTRRELDRIREIVRPVRQGPINPDGPRPPEAVLSRTLDGLRKDQVLLPVTMDRFEAKGMAQGPLVFAQAPATKASGVLVGASVRAASPARDQVFAALANPLRNPLV